VSATTDPAQKHSTATFSFTTDGDQTISGNGGIGKVVINKSSGTVTATDNPKFRTFTLTNGTFVSTNETLTIGKNGYVNGDWTHTGGTFTHNNGTVSLEAKQEGTSYIDVPTTENFYNLITSNSYNGHVSISSEDTLVATGTLTLGRGSRGYVDTGTLEAQGNEMF